MQSINVLVWKDKKKLHSSLAQFLIGFFIDSWKKTYQAATMFSEDKALSGILNSKCTVDPSWFANGTNMILQSRDFRLEHFSDS